MRNPVPSSGKLTSAKLSWPESDVSRASKASRSFLQKIKKGTETCHSGRQNPPTVSLLLFFFVVIFFFLHELVSDGVVRVAHRTDAVAEAQVLQADLFAQDLLARRDASINWRNRAGGFGVRGWVGPTLAVHSSAGRMVVKTGMPSRSSRSCRTSWPVSRSSNSLQQQR